MKTDTIIIDVREKDEFKSVHVAGAINLPLSSFSFDAPSVLKSLNDQNVSIMCLSGKRAGLAMDQIKQIDSLNTEKYTIYPNGIKGWQEEGKDVVAIGKQPMSIMRQVQATAGFIILLSTILALTVSPNFWYLATFIGAGLTFSGLSGTCGMAVVLRLMPWNKSH